MYVYLKSIGAGAAVVVHRVIRACAVVLAGVGQAGLTFSLHAHFHWACVMQTHQPTHKKHTHHRDKLALFDVRRKGKCEEVHIHSDSWTLVRDLHLELNVMHFLNFKIKCI